MTIPTLNSRRHSTFMVQMPAAIPNLALRSQTQQLPSRGITHTHRKRCAQLEKANDFTGRDKYSDAANAYALHTEMCARGLIMGAFQERCPKQTRGTHTDTEPKRTKRALALFSRNKSSGGLWCLTPEQTWPGAASPY